MDITIEQIIDRPRDEVAGYVMDPLHDTAWIGGITKSEPLEAPFPMTVDYSFGDGAGVDRQGSRHAERADGIRRNSALSYGRKPSRLAISERRAIRSSVGGWVANKLSIPAALRPRAAFSGLTMNMCASEGLSEAGAGT